MKITALTSFCVDFFPELDKVYVGGNSLNFATQCKFLGYEKTSVIGAIGKDKFGKLIETGSIAASKVLSFVGGVKQE